MKFDRIYIEIGNVCNLQCNFCPEVEREKKLMSIDFFRQVASECKELANEITMHVMGEPMNHPQFAEMVKVAGEVDVPVNITTNGTLLRDKSRREVLFSPHIRQVNFSLQSVTAQAGSTANDEQLRARYLHSIFDFIKEVFVRRPDLYINLRLWNIGSDLANETGNAIFIEPIEKEFNFKLTSPVDVAFRKSRKIVNRLYLHFDSRFEWPQLDGPLRQTEGFCHALKSHIGILADGTVVPCCLDKEAKLNLGQIVQGEKGQLARILGAERAQKIRTEFDKGRVCEDLCQRCQYIERFTKKKAPAKTSSREILVGNAHV
jgi:organic radical activating enzyme